jgi:hypothetical protein
MNSASASGDSGGKPKPGLLRTAFEKLPGRFPTIESAFGVTLSLLGAMIVGYVAIHIAFPSKSRPWCEAIQLSEEILFEPVFCQSFLERYISPADLAEFKQSVKARCEETARLAVRQRKLVFAPIPAFLSNALNHIPVSQHPHLWQPGADRTETDYRMTRLADLRHWLETATNGLAADRRGEWQGLVNALQRQEQRETNLESTLETEIFCLEPVLAFDWLYLDKYAWVFEMFVWCWVGVLANTIIKLIESMRGKREYDPNEFCLLFPKAVLAPVLGMVVTALWSSGLSESQINFANLPYLLVFFFALGFATESLYDKIVKLTELIVSRAATPSEERLAAAAAQSRYKFITRAVDVGDVPPPRNLNELESKLAAVAGAAFERGVVSRSARNEPTP